MSSKLHQQPQGPRVFEKAERGRVSSGIQEPEVLLSVDISGERLRRCIFFSLGFSGGGVGGESFVVVVCFVRLLGRLSVATVF